MNGDVYYFSDGSVFRLWQRTEKMDLNVLDEETRAVILEEDTACAVK